MHFDGFTFKVALHSLSSISPNDIIKIHQAGHGINIRDIPKGITLKLKRPCSECSLLLDTEVQLYLLIATDQVKGGEQRSLC